MATLTFGTNATTSLSALRFVRGIGVLPFADVALIANAIKDDSNVAHRIVPGAFTSAGMLEVPGRGFLRVQPGDYVAVDSTGWPMLISANAIANGPWTHS